MAVVPTLDDLNFLTVQIDQHGYHTYNLGAFQKLSAFSRCHIHGNDDFVKTGSRHTYATELKVYLLQAQLALEPTKRCATISTEALSQSHQRVTASRRDRIASVTSPTHIPATRSSG